MKITPIDSGYVATHLSDTNIYRISACDDGKNGKKHCSVRIKHLHNLTIEEFENSLDNSDYAFIKVEVDGY